MSTNYGNLSMMLSKVVSSSVISKGKAAKSSLEQLLGELLAVYFQNNGTLEQLEILMGNLHNILGELRESAESAESAEKPCECKNGSGAIPLLKEFLDAAKQDKVCPACQREVSKKERGILVSRILKRLKEEEKKYGIEGSHSEEEEESE